MRCERLATLQRVRGWRMLRNRMQRCQPSVDVYQLHPAAAILPEPSRSTPVPGIAVTESSTAVGAATCCTAAIAASPTAATVCTASATAPLPPQPRQRLDAVHRHPRRPRLLRCSVHRWRHQQ